MSGGQAEISENSGDHRGIFNGGDDLQGATTEGASFNVDIEYPFTKALPGFRPSGRRSPFKSAPGGFVSKRAQLMRARVDRGGAPSGSSKVSLRVSGLPGMICGRSLAFGASVGLAPAHFGCGRRPR